MPTSEADKSSASSTITWLHLSDLHARLRDDWDARAIVEGLTRDLRQLQKEEALRPDLLFFTGDIAFGSTPTEKLEDQYQRVKVILDSVRRCFDPEIPLRDVYIVPGNHDVDRTEITPDQTSWLRHPDRTLPEIVEAVRSGTKQWRAWMDRLHAYRKFIMSYGLLHLEPEDPRLLWGDERELAGMRVGIAGLNSAWSCVDDNDKGKMWCAAQWQVATVKQRIGPVDFSFALMHHPSNWLTDREDPAAGRLLRRSFEVLLHGHEHQDWIERDAESHLTVSAGASYQCSWMHNGYNIGQLDCRTGSGWVRLRQWDPTGGGWVPRDVAGKTKNGVWPLEKLAWLHPVAHDERETPSTSGVSSVVDPPAPAAISIADHFTQRFCNYVIEQCDVLELFGCDIPPELQKHQLSVAYVSLNLRALTEGGKNALQDGQSIPSAPSENGADDEEVERSASIDSVLDQLPSEEARLLISGPAGAGKSTLLRWCAIQAGTKCLGGFRIGTSKRDGSNTTIATSLSQTGNPETWRSKIPVLVRLRECPGGRLPAANDIPKFLAKHLPSAPANWLTDILDAGRALVLLDGVDEVHRDNRGQLANEIDELVRTYPKCTYIVTTRPGAVDQGWLGRLNFREAEVEPMGRSDREEFIDRWFRSAALETRNRPRPGEDLIATATRLKNELADHPELAALATNPLICAMICALYRERQERLPETPPELCEALCAMLLHRRERETPGLDAAQFALHWRELQYAQKRALLADLAWSMVEKGESWMEVQAAEALVSDALTTTPGRSPDEAPEILQALLERSGLLRPAGDGRIEFVHNTLKEYLAALVVIERGDWKLVSAHSDDAAWQPVILFALSVGGEAFNSGLVRALLRAVDVPEDAPRRKRSSKHERTSVAKLKAREFFLVRCRAAAKRLALDLSTTIDSIAQRFLPPASMREAEALGRIGPRILSYSAATLADPEWWKKQTCPMCVRCLRLLRRIGGQKAATILRGIARLPPFSSQLTGEWLLASSELCPGNPPTWPFSDTAHVSAMNTRVRDLTPLAQLTSIERLDVSETMVVDLSQIAGLNIIALDISSTPVTDLGPIANVSSLVSLNVARTAVLTIAPLSVLKNLAELDLRGTLVSDLSPLSTTNNLRELDIASTPVADISVLQCLPQLRRLYADNSRLEAIDGVAACANLSFLSVDGTGVRDFSVLRRMRELRVLSMCDCVPVSFAPLAELAGLSRLDVTGTPIIDLSPISILSSLLWLSLRRTRVVDVSPLENLKQLEHLDLAWTAVEDISGLAALSSLQVVDISHTRVADLRALERQPLEDLNVAQTEVNDLSPLLRIKSLRVIRVSPAIDTQALAAFAVKRPDVSIHVLDSRSPF